MSVHEKSAWVSIGAIVVLYIPYFVAVSAHPMESMYRFWFVGIGMAVIMGVFHAVDAVIQVMQKRGSVVFLTDELDRAIQQKAIVVASTILAFVVVGWIIVMIYALPTLGTSVVEATSDKLQPFVAWPVEQVMRSVQWLFAGFVLSNIVFYTVVIIEYRGLNFEQ